MKKTTHEALAARRMSPEGAEIAPRTPLYALLDNVRSLYNVGSIFRTSDGALVSGLYLCGYTPCPPRREIEKTALGATRTVPWSHHRDPLEAVALLRGKGVRICALEQTDASIPYHQVVPGDLPLCLVVGNELGGVSAALLDAADMAIEIPMLGTKLSLNVAVAYGIALFELARIARGER